MKLTSSRMFPFDRRTATLVAASALIPSMIGASVIGILTFRGLPMGAALGEQGVMRLNVVAAVIYSCFVVPIAVACGLVGTTIPRNAEEAVRHRATTAIPARLTAINGVVWTVAAVMLAVVNTGSPWLAVTLGVSTLLGGGVTAALTYWFCTRALRSRVAEVLTDNPPTRPRGPGLRLRAVASWGLGTGVPLLMVLLVAASALVVDYSAHRLAVAVLALGGGAVISGLVVAVFTGTTIADPIDEVRRGMRRVERGDYDVSVPVFDASELGLLQAGFNTMADGLREREQLRDLFGRHVGQDVARLAEEAASKGGGVKIGEGNVNCEVAVLFVDLVGSTRLAATVSPEELVAILNDFFEAVVDVVESRGGLINKFEGDAALAIFGAPLPVSDCAGRALAAARELHDRLHSSAQNIEAGIGVSAGVAVAGYIGHPDRYEYTVIGDPVNEAARVAEIAKSSGGVAASAGALSRTGPSEARQWQVVRSEVLRGRDRPTQIAVPTTT